MSFVLDASLTLAWCFPDEASEYSNAMLRKVQNVRAVVPALWSYEVTNGLVTAIKRERTTEKKAQTFLELLAELPIEMESAPKPSSSQAAEIRRIALAEQLSAYDAAYLQVAIDLSLPLATLDGVGKRMGLKQAAARRKVPLYQP